MRKVTHRRCFNSQRDGILPFHPIVLLISLSFQFPTGWNSTLSFQCRATAETCFNSQRDGILRPALAKLERIYIVSIPNGMEFYARNRKVVIRFRAFQFPTGWNSTQPRFLLMPISSSTFQFPTGWNSTKNRRKKREKVASFNSQRDGILQISSKRIHNEKRVSIPNGMEFYAIYDSWDEAFPHSFNSQRDGILLASGSSLVVLQRVSIPNGMEFYHVYESTKIKPKSFQFPTGWNSTIRSI